jgi:hypothetical protein
MIGGLVQCEVPTYGSAQPRSRYARWELATEAVGCGLGDGHQTMMRPVQEQLKRDVIGLKANR